MTTFSIITAIGLIVVQWLASGLGGFVTGRLRTKWVGVHTHEVFFRDTAHGFLTWALATVFGALLLASAASNMLGGGVHAAATIAGGAAQTAGEASSTASTGVSAYDVDTLFRSDKPDAAANPQQAVGQARRILSTGLMNGQLPPADKAYLVQLISTSAGIPQADAQHRVDDMTAKMQAAADKARQAADTARKAAAHLSIFTALSMLVGAFVASVAAAYGGSFRDEH